MGQVSSKEMEQNIEGLIKMIMTNAPKSIGAILVFVNNETGALTMRAMRLDRERTKDALKACLNGYGQQGLIDE